jgi:hypothetical protein
LGALHELAEKWRNRVNFLVVYICEAHPIDGWQVTSNLDDGVEIESPRTDAERLAVASDCALNLEIGLPVVIDPIDNPLANAYGALPDRLYLIDSDGRVAYQGEEGPIGFKPVDLDAAIEGLLAE